MIAHITNLYLSFRSIFPFKIFIPALSEREINVSLFRFNLLLYRVH